jgi:8-oxo-dGTP pyrophosphatase MutT (NUDIX family)
MARIFAGFARIASRADSVQVAAVCYRRKESSVEFLLVKTSAGKWTFPKGRLNPSMSASESAAQEAWEEAGAQGRITEKHFGSYLDTKRTLGHDARTREIRIVTYLLEVYSTVVPEESGRKPTWFAARDAKRLLAEGRASVYGRQIARIVDLAVERLTIRKPGRARVLVGAQSRRLLPAR